MIVSANALTPPALIADLAGFTRKKTIEFTPRLFWRMLKSEHSPIRALMFDVQILGIPYPASVHLSRHKVGVEHYVSTSRPDITGKPRSIDALVNHRMIANAQALISMARRRLCTNASEETREAMELVRDAVREAVSNASGFEYGQLLGYAMVPDCEYRGGCHELKCCGRKESTYCEVQ